MTRSTILERLRADARNRESKPREKHSIGSQLGFYIGNYIVMRFLPTLNIYGHDSARTIHVSDEEKIEYDRLDDKWYNERVNGETTKENWVNLRRYAHMLEEKYLPKKLIMYIPYFDIPEENLSEVKEGIRSELWDSDICNYHIESNDDIEIIIDEFHETMIGGAEIILNLDIEKEIHWNGEIIKD
jgi:hypothetical protein